MKTYFNLESVTIDSETKLVSIACLGEGLDSFYGVFTDYDASKVSEEQNSTIINDLDIKESYYTGDSSVIRAKLLTWLSKQKEVVWCGDNSINSYVLLLKFLGLSLDENVYHELNQDVARFIGISECRAKKYSRKSILSEAGTLVLGKENNGLRKCVFLKALHDIVSSVEYDEAYNYKERGVL